MLHALVVASLVACIVYGVCFQVRWNRHMRKRDTPQCEAKQIQIELRRYA
jgi:hypothetical protein